MKILSLYIYILKTYIRDIGLLPLCISDFLKEESKFVPLGFVLLHLLAEILSVSLSVYYYIYTPQMTAVPGLGWARMKLGARGFI